MARVICTIPHADETINGVKFTPDRGELISEEIPLEVAKKFAAIPGFKLVGEKPVQPPLEGVVPKETGRGANRRRASAGADGEGTKPGAGNGPGDPDDKDVDPPPPDGDAGENKGDGDESSNPPGADGGSANE